MSARESPPPQSLGKQAELELRKHFQGRRDGQRVITRIPVELICLERNLKAHTVNLSRSGTLLEVVEDGTNLGMAELIDFCHEIARLFAAGGTVDFQCGVTRTMAAVRVTAGGLGKRMAPLVACHFKDYLEPEDFQRIGIPTPANEDLPEDLEADPSAAREVVREPLIVTESRKVPAIQELLRWAADLEATDIHIKAGSPPRLRLNGSLQAVGSERISADEARQMVRNFLTDEQWKEFQETGDLDVGIALQGVARFRINVLRSRKKLGMVLRRIPEHVPHLAELGLAPACLDLAQKRRGLVLVTGGSGSGKSTTLAAMLRHINDTRACHIVTLEDPVEFVHEENEAQITQREVGRDTRNFASALRRVLRQDPDVIMIGEMRDLETIQLAVTAAETGHLVFATLHTTSAAHTVDRIVDVFPAEQQRQIRTQLANILQGVISQVLVPRAEGGLTVAQEILIVNDAVRALIRDRKSLHLNNVMQTGGNDGMQTLEDALNSLAGSDIITYETAVEFANVPGRIRRVSSPTPTPERPEDLAEEDAEPVEEPAPATFAPKPLQRGWSPLGRRR